VRSGDERSELREAAVRERDRHRALAESARYRWVDPWQTSPSSNSPLVYSATGAEGD
jgi:hypothetical protein